MAQSHGACRHEPFFTQQEFQEMYPHHYDGPLFDWPPYRSVAEDPEQVRHIQCMCTSRQPLVVWSISPWSSLWCGWLFR